MSVDDAYTWIFSLLAILGGIIFILSALLVDFGHIDWRHGIIPAFLGFSGLWTSMVMLVKHLEG